MTGSEKGPATKRQLPAIEEMTLKVGEKFHPQDRRVLGVTPRLVGSSRMSRASGSDRANRSSLVTTSVSPV